MTQKMIRKRDGRLVEFHTEKIRNAIWRSFLGVGQTGMEDVSDALARKVETMLELEGCEPEVEHVQDLVEQVLMQEGYGRTDIVLRPKASGRPNLVFELKVVDSQGQLDSGLDEAMEQIHDRKYYIGMSGKVVLVAMSFWNKVPKVRTDVVTVPS